MQRTIFLVEHLAILAGGVYFLIVCIAAMCRSVDQPILDVVGFRQCRGH
jgi:hypothetical protein